MPVLAYATSISPFLNNSILDEAIASRFPGASIWPVAKRAAIARGWEFSTADIVLDRIRSGELQARDVRVIQEEDAALGSALVGAGARASLLLCGESPLFARDFYRRLSEYSRGFDHALLFRGALSRIAPATQGHVLHFPGFHRDRNTNVQSWEARAQVVLVAGNKYWRHEGVPILQRIQRGLQTLRDRSHRDWLKGHQLHDRRLELLVGLYDAGLLTVFGQGWDVSHHLPVYWREKLSRAKVEGRPLGPTEKQHTVSGFRFALTMENFQYPGYVTEKIIDALAAGSIPLYLGAPDIGDFIPSDAFIDLRNFSSPDDLVAYLSAMDEHTGMAMINRGQEFLRSRAGDDFTFERQGECIVDIAVA